MAHLLRIADPPSNEAWTDDEDIYDGWVGVARPSIIELVPWAEAHAASAPWSASFRRCDVCYATTHPYLDTCVGCGRYMGVAINRVAADAREQVLLAEIKEAIEFERVLPRGPERMADHAALSIFSGLDPERYREFQQDVERTSAARSAATTREIGGLNGLASLEFRYLGGLPAYPAGVGVRVSPDEDALRLSSRGAIIAEIPYHAILGVWPFAQDTAVSRMQLGVISRNFLILPNPTFRGGALGFIAVVGGRETSFAIGNREGWLVKKGDFAYYSMLAGSLETLIVAAVRQREAIIGPDALAAGLGLRMPPS